MQFFFLLHTTWHLVDSRLVLLLLQKYVPLQKKLGELIVRYNFRNTQVEKKRKQRKDVNNRI